MRGLMTKFYYEARWTVLLFGLGLMAIMATLTIVLPFVLGDIDQFLDSIPFIRPIIAALLGTDPNAELNSRAIQAFLWVHPTVLALAWGAVLALCTRVPAGEIDRGSVDWLMSLPVSRSTIWLTEFVGWSVSGVIVLFIGVTGHLLASPWMPDNLRPDRLLVIFVTINLLAVYLAVGGITCLVCAFCDRRFRAIGIVFSVLVLSFLQNFLAQFWEPAQTVSFLSVLEYYRPAEVFESGGFPFRNVVILLAVAGVTWLTGLRVFVRRNICTV